MATRWSELFEVARQKLRSVLGVWFSWIRTMMSLALFRLPSALRRLNTD